MSGGAVSQRPAGFTCCCCCCLFAAAACLLLLLLLVCRPRTPTPWHLLTPWNALHCPCRRGGGRRALLPGRRRAGPAADAHDAVSALWSLAAVLCCAGVGWAAAGGAGQAALAFQRLHAHLWLMPCRLSSHLPAPLPLPSPSPQLCGAGDDAGHGWRRPSVPQHHQPRRHHRGRHRHGLPVSTLAARVHLPVAVRNQCAVPVQR